MSDATRILAAANPLNLAVGDTRTDADGTPIRRFKRYAIEVGQTYHKKSWATPLHVTEERAARWLSNWQAMKANGVPVKLTSDHKDPNKAENVMGDVVDLTREGNWLVTFNDVRGQKNIEIAEANKDVSVEIYPEVKDGRGNVYKDAIRALTFTPIPVVHSQPIAASLDEDDIYHLSTETNMKPIFSAIAKLAGVSESDVTEATALSILEKHGESCKAMKLSLEEAQGQIKKLSTKEEPDAKFLSMVEKLNEQELKHAVAMGELTPAAAESLKSEFGKLKLSMGEESTDLLGKVLDVIRKNKPVETGEKSKDQEARKLSREVPDADPVKVEKKANPWLPQEEKAA